MAHTEHHTPKAFMGSSTTGGRPYMGKSPRQAKSRQAVEYVPTGTPNNDYRRCTVPSWLTCNSATCSKHGTRSTPEARWENKECTPRPYRLSVDSDPPSSLVTWNRAGSASERFSGSWPVPSTSPIYRCGQGGLGSTLMVRGRASVRRRRCQLPRELCQSR